jgi:hypothetical protein
MSHVEANFAVFTDDETFELVARQGGPAGVVVAHDPSAVEIELDAADPTQLTALRLWHDGALAQDQVRILEALLGDAAGPVLALFGDPRPRRTALRSRRLSSLPGDTSSELSLFVAAQDALGRLETPASVRPLLEFAAITAASSGSLGLATPALPSRDALEYAVLGTPPEARALLAELLEEAASRGLLDPALVRTMLGRTAEPLADDAFSDVVDASAEPMRAARDLATVFSSLSASRVHDPSLAAPLVLHPGVLLDPSSVPCGDVSFTWVHDANLLVRATAAPDAMLWVRVRRDADGTVVAAGPLLPAQRGHEALLLVAELDHVVVDIVPAVDAPVLSHAAGALARAYEHGRRAGRLERLGRLQEAEQAWRECSRFHRLAGDPQREKLALARGFTTRATAPATLVDHLLD